MMHSSPVVKRHVEGIVTLTPRTAQCRDAYSSIPQLGDTWFLDEVFVTINGQHLYLWRALDQDGDLIDLLVQPRRDGRAARRFFRKLLRSQRQEPSRLVTDKLGSYRVAHRDVMPWVPTTRPSTRTTVPKSRTNPRDNGSVRCEASRHLPTRSDSYMFMASFRISFAWVDLLGAVHHRMLRARSFRVWAELTAA